LEKAINYIAENIFQFIETYKNDEKLKISNKINEEILTRAILIHRKVFFETKNVSKLVKYLTKSRNLKNISQCLRSE